MSGIVPMYYEPVHFRPCLSSKQGMVHFVVFFHHGRFFCPISTAVSNLVRVMFALTRLIAGNSNNYKIITKKKSSSLVSFNSKKKNTTLLSISPK